MNTLVETIQKIGIFLIAAQAIMHFAPGNAYTKYIKLIVGIMVLVLFLSPVYQIITDEMIFLSLDERRYGIVEEQTQTQGFSMGWDEMESYIEKQTWKQETVLEQMEDEIKSRLNDEIEKMYLQSNNNHSEKTWKFKIANVIIKETEPIFLRIAVYRSASLIGTDREGYPDWENISGDGAVNIDTVQVSEILIEENGPNGEHERGKENERSEDLQVNTQNDVQNEVGPDSNLTQWFAGILGLEPDRMEVIVYGSDQ